MTLGAASWVRGWPPRDSKAALTGIKGGKVVLQRVGVSESDTPSQPSPGWCKLSPTATLLPSKKPVANSIFHYTSFHLKLSARCNLVNINLWNKLTLSANSLGFSQFYFSTHFCPVATLLSGFGHLCVKHQEDLWLVANLIFSHSVPWSFVSSFRHKCLYQIGKQKAAKGNTRWTIGISSGQWGKKYRPKPYPLLVKQFISMVMIPSWSNLVTDNRTTPREAGWLFHGDRNQWRRRGSATKKSPSPACQYFITCCVEYPSIKSWWTEEDRGAKSQRHRQMNNNSP